MRRRLRSVASHDRGASLVFVLVAVSVLALLLGGLTTALTGGFGANKGFEFNSDAPGSGDVLIQQALETGLDAVSATNARDPKKSKGKCYGVNAGGSTGSSYIDYPLGTNTPLFRVFCTPYTTNVSDSLLIPSNSQPDVKNGIALQDRLYVCGSGNYLTQGPVAVKKAVSLYSDTGCTTSLSNCPQVSQNTEFAPSSGSCPGLYIDDASPGDGTLTTPACNPATAVWTASGVNCAASSVDLTSDLTTPSQLPISTLPSGLGLVDLASSTSSGSGAVVCSGHGVTLNPGVYDDTPGTSTALGTDGTQVSKFLNGLGAGTATCATQTGALNAASDNLTTSLPLGDRSGFIPGDKLTVGSSTFTVANGYVPATGAGAVTVVPDKGTANALSSVKVGLTPSSLTLAATSTRTLAGTTTNASADVDLATGSMTLKSAFAKDATTMTLDGTGAAPAVNDYITGTGLTGSQKVTAVSKTVSASYKTVSASPTITVASGSNNGTIYVGDTVTGTGIPASTTVTAIPSSTTLTLSNSASATDAVGVSLTFTSTGPKSITFSPKANAASAAAGGSISIYAGTDPTIPLYSVVTGTGIASGTYASATVGSTPMTALTLSKAATASGATSMTFTTSAVTGTTAVAVGTTPAVGQRLDIFGSGNAAVDASDCLITALSNANKTFVCSVQSATSLSAATLTNGTVLDVSTGHQPASAVFGTAATAVTAGQVLLLDGTGISELDNNLCTVTTAGTSFACSQTTDPTAAASGSTGNAYVKVTLANGSVVATNRSCVDVGGSWCQGPTFTGVTINSINATAGSKDITVTTAAAHGLAAGDSVTLSGLGGTLKAFPYEGTFTVKSLGSTTTFAITTTYSSLTTTTYSKGVAPMGANPKSTQGAPAITAITMPPGQYFFALSSNWAFTSSAVTLNAGMMGADLTLPDGTVTRCVPSYSASKDGLTSDQISAIAGQGATFVFGSSGAKDTGLSWTAGNVSVCPQAVEVDAHPTDRPTAIYGPGPNPTSSNVTGDLTGSLSAPSYFAADFTGGSSETITGRSTCSALTTGTNYVITSIASTSGSKDVTITVSASHGMSAGDSVTISGLGKSLDGKYKGTFTVKSVPSSTSFVVTTSTTGDGTTYTSSSSPALGANPKATPGGGAALGSCEILYVPTARSSDDGTTLMLYGGVFAPSSRISMTLNFTNDDAVALYGIVANALRVTTSTVPAGTTTCTGKRKTGCHSTGKSSQAQTFFRFEAFPCAARYNGTGLCTMTTPPDASWVAPGQTFKVFSTGKAVTVSSPALTVNSIGASSTTVTVTTASAHGLAEGDWVSLSGVTPTGYSGTFRVASVPSATTFTYSLASALAAPATSSPKAAWTVDSCPPRATYPWVGCIVVKFDPKARTSPPQYVVVGPVLAPDCVALEQSACWAIETT